MSPIVGALAVVCAAAAHAPSGTSASMASFAVCLTLPTKLPAALFDELRMLEKVLDRCEERVTSGEGAGRLSKVIMAALIERNSADECVGINQYCGSMPAQAAQLTARMRTTISR
jgi:hypothetical protein